VFLGVRLGFTYLVRPYLLAPQHRSVPLGSVVQGFGSTNGGPTTLFAGAPNLPNAWVYSARIVDNNGHALTSQIANNACPVLAQPLPAPPAGAGQRGAVPSPVNGLDALQACVTKLSSTYHGVLTYQPASRYWIFQRYETGIFAAAAAALAALCFYWVRRRA
jgi:hypothetical protein